MVGERLALTHEELALHCVRAFAPTSALHPLDERSVGQYDVAVLVAQNRCRVGGMESATEHPDAADCISPRSAFTSLKILVTAAGAGWVLPAG
jgi:hypothetical protein